MTSWPAWLFGMLHATSLPEMARCGRSRWIAFGALALMACAEDAAPRGELATYGALRGSGISGNGQGETIPGAEGTLTSGVWDDNQNFEHFLAFLRAGRQELSEGLPSFGEEEHVAAQSQSAAALKAHSELDIALLLDTTASMGDELDYLKTELAAIAGHIQATYPGLRPRWSLVVYRDRGDAYVVRSVDFKDDLEAFRAALAAQSAENGGDYPEAVAEALEALARLSWRSGEQVARLAFWVADAPHHAQEAERSSRAVRSLSAKGVHLYPVASSGVDLLAELFMRSAAQLSFGRYLFLSDDSGIGEAHREPSIPCYFITRLDQAMRRMIDVEVRGMLRPPAAEEVLRSQGEPVAGRCTLADGSVATAF